MRWRLSPACLLQIAGRNRMMRYMGIQGIKRDPAWMEGEYKSEPVEGLRLANTIILIMGSAPLRMQKQLPTREAAEQYVDSYWAHRDQSRCERHDLLPQRQPQLRSEPAAREPSPTPVLWINSADDYINPPELGIAEKMVKRMPHARFILLPISDATRGHGTHTAAAVWKEYLAEFMIATEPKN